MASKPWWLFLYIGHPFEVGVPVIVALLFGVTMLGPWILKETPWRSLYHGDLSGQGWTAATCNVAPPPVGCPPLGSGRMVPLGSGFSEANI